MAQTKKRPKGWLVGKQQIDDWLDIAQAQIIDQDYNGALRTGLSFRMKCRDLLSLRHSRM